MHCEDYLVDQISRVRPDYVPAQNLAPSAGDDLDQSICLSAMALSTLLNGWRKTLTWSCSLLYGEEGIPQDRATLVLRDVGEEVQVGYVVGGVEGWEAFLSGGWCSALNGSLRNA